MMRIALVILAVLCLTETSLAQNGALPRFEDYPVKAIFNGKPVPAKIVTSSQRIYRTRLIEGAKQGPNFAGHYTIVIWGCGSGCASFGIIDARTGETHFPTDIAIVFMPIKQDEDSIQFHKDSRMLVIVGYSQDKPIGRYYYEWLNNRLKLIRFIEKR